MNQKSEAGRPLCLLRRMNALPSSQETGHLLGQRAQQRVGGVVRTRTWRRHLPMLARYGLVSLPARQITGSFPRNKFLSLNGIKGIAAAFSRVLAVRSPRTSLLA